MYRLSNRLGRNQPYKLLRTFQTDPLVHSHWQRLSFQVEYFHGFQNNYAHIIHVYRHIQYR